MIITLKISQMCIRMCHRWMLIYNLIRLIRKRQALCIYRNI